MERATTSSVYQDRRIECPSVSGLLPGAVLLNKQGVPIPETGLALSSFDWAYPRALQGLLVSLRHGKSGSTQEDLENLIYAQDDDGNVVPLLLIKPNVSITGFSKTVEY